MDLIITIIVIAAVIALVWWASQSIPFPPPLMFLRWLLPLLVVLVGLVWLLKQLGVT